tara:strand:- start:15994 stop:17454 length:1461 start_codon:yes stop_codon:yes gene_type:complete
VILTDSAISQLQNRADQCANYLLDSKSVLCISHIDADGLTSAAIATQAIQRANIPLETAFSKRLGEPELKQLTKTDHETILFTDFGSGQIEKIIEYSEKGNFNPIICDHHQPSIAPSSNSHTLIDLDFHLNPLLFEIDGASELSGAGTCYFLARALESGSVDNRDLASLAVVGAIGDMQARDKGLIGPNKIIAQEGVDKGVLDIKLDLAFYGKQTRPLPKLLEYSSEFGIPSISNNPSGSIRFLKNLDIDVRENGKWKFWVDLSHSDKKAIVNELVKHAISRGLSIDKISSFISPVYELTQELSGTALREATEFSTILNATARYGRPDVGLSICLGNRNKSLTRAKNLLAVHRKNLAEGIGLLNREGVVMEENFQWFHAQDKIRDTIVGIVAGMVLGMDGTDPNKPIFAFAKTEEGDLKVSSRGTPILVKNGLNLSEVMRISAEHVGGEGGGHDIAAGATIPLQTEKLFLEQIKTTLELQLYNSSS